MGYVVRVTGSQMAAVDRILGDLGLGDTPRLLVMNKIDLLSAEAQATVTRAEGGVSAIPVSARDRNSTAPLLGAVEMALWREGRLASEQLMVGGIAAAPAPSDVEPETDTGEARWATATSEV